MVITLLDELQFVQKEDSLYLSVTTHAVIGQYGPLKFKAVFVAKMFRDLSPSVLNVYGK